MLLRDLGYFNYWFFIIIHLFDLFYHTIFYLMIQQLMLFDNSNLVFFSFFVFFFASFCGADIFSHNKIKQN